jgi:hypothetical protein
LHGNLGRSFKLWRFVAAARRFISEMNNSMQIATANPDSVGDLYNHQRMTGGLTAGSFT